MGVALLHPNKLLVLTTVATVSLQWPLMRTVSSTILVASILANLFHRHRRRHHHRRGVHGGGVRLALTRWLQRHVHRLQRRGAELLRWRLASVTLVQERFEMDHLPGQLRGRHMGEQSCKRSADLAQRCFRPFVCFSMASLSGHASPFIMNFESIYYEL